MEPKGTRTTGERELVKKSSEGQEEGALDCSEGEAAEFGRKPVTCEGFRELLMAPFLKTL